MRDISREEMQHLLDRAAKECSRSVVDHLRFRLRSILEFAVSEGVAERNPATVLYTPRHCQPGRERKVLDSEHLAFIPEVLGIREHVIFRLATWEGMRPGEIIGLQLGDFEGDCVWVRRTAQEVLERRLLEIRNREGFEVWLEGAGTPSNPASAR